jgi:hypothetical protein
MDVWRISSAATRRRSRSCSPASPRRSRSTRSYWPRSFYRKLRPRFLDAGPAAWTHRASGDTIAVLLIVVAIMCLSYFGLEDDGAFHAVTGFLLLLVLAVKVVVIRWWHAAGRFLPVLGLTVFVLLGATWASTAGAFLA